MEAFPLLDTHRTIACLVFPTQGHRIHTNAQTHAIRLRHPPFFSLIMFRPRGRGCSVGLSTEETESEEVVTFSHHMRLLKKKILKSLFGMFLIQNQETKNWHLFPSYQKIKHRSYIILINSSDLTEKDCFKLHLWNIPWNTLNTICVFPLHGPTWLQLWL